MKVAEISGGVAATLRVKPSAGSFQNVHLHEELVLVRSADQTLLRCDAEVWAVEGVTPADTTQLIDVVVGGLPMVAYVAQARAGALVVETRRFTQELRVAEPMQLGLDEKGMDELRSRHNVGGTVSDVAAWLEDRLFLPPAPGAPADLRRMVVSGDERGRLDTFRIHGLKVAADIRRVDNKLRIERVVRGGKNNSSRLMLLFAPVSIADATLTAELHGAVRTALSQAVAENHSYLQIWQKYHELERQSVVGRAQAFGALEYKSCRRRPDGGWQFQLQHAEDLPARIAALGEWGRFELEAAARAPAFGFSASPATPDTKKPAAKEKLLSAAIMKLSDKGLLDLAGPDEDEDQPKPPESGFLYLSTGGDETRLKRREQAEKALRTGDCPMPQLGLLMEGRPAPAARRGRVSVHSPLLKAELREVFGSSGPTVPQQQAIEIALNTPDICLIQGPPGTGKTKVITAIERCLAVLADQGVEPSHRILVCAAQHDAVENVVQRTEVFGLPAVKVGRSRRGSDAGIDPAQSFVDKRAEQLRARVQVPPEAERLAQARNIVLACVRTRSLPQEQADRIHELLRVLHDLLPHDLRDKALQHTSKLRRPAGRGDSEDAELLIRAARGVRTDAISFSDDGPINARIALVRLAGVLTEQERAFLARCAAVDEAAPSWLDEGRPMIESLVDRLTQPALPAQPRLDDDTQRLLLDILDTVERRLTTTRVGDEAVLTAYLTDLESDPEGVKEALAQYTVVLAATLQQAAGKQMRDVRGIDEGRTTFESVIVDEAARANPLDLFIPLSMAVRRVILVGDHRQLPHLLEPEVERQLADGVDDGTVEKQTLDAVQASLFERLWVLLRALEQKDHIQRTVTLDAQYRMHPDLGAYVSREFYEIHHDARIESPRLADQFGHDLPGYTQGGVPRFAAWLDVPLGREVRGASKSRPAEARAIAKEVRRLIEHDPQLTFGVIAFYSAQVDAIGEAMIEVGLTEHAAGSRDWQVAERWRSTGDKERLRIGTVDAFQGKEFDVVFLSVTRSNELPGETDKQQRQKFGHLMLENRLCVAMSRQQRLLVAVGDLAFVRAEDARTPLRALRAFSELCGGHHGAVR